MSHSSDGDATWPSRDDDLSLPDSSPTSQSDNQAFAELESLVEADPGSSEFPRLVEAYRRAGQVEHAHRLAQRGLEASPERLGGRVALALCLIDMSELSEASQELARILENVPEVPSGRLSAFESPATDHPAWARPLARPSPISGSMAPNETPSELASEEIDRAFATAAPDPDGMLDAVEAAEVNLDTVSTIDERGDFAPASSPVFATETMAGLLERQGDRESAEEIRDELREAAEPDFSTSLEPDPELEHAPEPEPEAVVAIASEDPAPDPVSLLDESAARRGRISATLEGWLDNIRKEVA